MNQLDKEYKQYHRVFENGLLLIYAVVILMGIGAGIFYLSSCSTKPIVIGFEGSPNVVVREEDFKIDRALKHQDSLHKIEINNLLQVWQKEVDSLQIIIDDREGRLNSFERKSSGYSNF